MGKVEKIETLEKAIGKRVRVEIGRESPRPPFYPGEVLVGIVREFRGGEVFLDGMITPSNAARLQVADIEKILIF